MSNQPILAFDCSTPLASVALRTGGRVYEQPIPAGKQASLLVATVDALLRAHTLPYSQLAAIVTTLGPGSFTGLRIALATAHGLAQAHATPLKTLTSSDAVARHIALRDDAPAQFHVALNAGKGEAFVQHFSRTGATARATDAIHLMPPDAALTLANCYSNLLPETDPFYIGGPQAATLCHIAPMLEATPLADAVPLYIRPPDATPPVQPPWLRAN